MQCSLHYAQEAATMELSPLTPLKQSGDVLFLMLGAVMVFAMHAGFAFLEVGSVRKKSQVNAFVKILTDWSVSTVVYFLIGFPLAYGISFLKPADQLMQGAMGYDLVHYFFLLCFAACIPGHYFRRYCRAGQVLAPGDRRGDLCRPVLSPVRVADLGQERCTAARGL
jgi:ammonium transporter